MFFLSFTTTDFQNPPDNNFLPANPTIAVGPSQVIVGTCNGIYSFTKDGDKDHVLEISAPSFYAQQEAGTIAQTNQIRFDQFTQRWFALSFKNAPAPNAKAVFYIAVSDGPEIKDCTVWSKFRFEQDLDFRPTGDTGLVVAIDFDFPSFGIDQNALYIGQNLYSSNNRNNFVSASVFVISKQSLLFGTPIASAFRNLSGLFAPVAVDNFDENPEFGYFIGITRTNPSNLLLYRISGAATATPTISQAVTITVDPVSPPTFSFFKNLYGAGYRLLNYDNRLFNAHIRNNTLFTVQHVGVNGQGTSTLPDRTAVRWYQIEDVDQNPTAIFGTLYDSAVLSDDTRSFSYPAVMTNKKGLMVISGTTSSLNTSLNGFAAHRHIDDSVDDDKLRKSVQLITESTSNYNSFLTFLSPNFGTTFAIEQWGQYSTSAPDGSAIWTVQPFANKASQWSIEAVKLKEKN